MKLKLGVTGLAVVVLASVLGILAALVVTAALSGPWITTPESDPDPTPISACDRLREQLASVQTESAALILDEQGIRLGCWGEPEPESILPTTEWRYVHLDSLLNAQRHYGDTMIPCSELGFYGQGGIAYPESLPIEGYDGEIAAVAIECSNE